jgi:hypothetical protein
MKADTALTLLNRFVGTWTTEATHPAMPGTIVRGTAILEWLEGERFLIQRARNDHPDFPDAISIIGVTGSYRVENGARTVATSAGTHGLRMHYYDSRGVFRDYAVRADNSALHFEHLAPGFSQRFTYKLIDGDATIDGVSQLCEDDRNWQDDLKIVYRRGS